jgi:hypothetical protein
MAVVDDKILINRLNKRKADYRSDIAELDAAYNRAVDAERKHIIDELSEEDTRARTPFDPEDKYEEVNHPLHYNAYDVEVIDMMEKVFGKEETAIFCKLNAFKYRMRAGNKPGQSADKDLNKERWYLQKKKELTTK